MNACLVAQAIGEPVRDYAQLARDWNYAAAGICAESAFIFRARRSRKFIFDESAFMRAAALTVPEPQQQTRLAFWKSRTTCEHKARTGTGGFLQCSTNAFIVPSAARCLIA
jgi:hypothetical protein